MRQKRQLHGERGAAIRPFAGSLDAAAVGLGDVLGYGQPEAAAAVRSRPGPVRAKEPFENVRKVRRRNPEARVGNCK